MRYTRLTLAAVLLAAGSATVALAGPREGGHGSAVPYAMGGDEPVSVTAMKQRHGEVFDEADADGDGELSAAELQQAMQRLRAERQLQRLDRDGNGLVSQEEFTYPLEHMLVRMDRDGDGEISTEEMNRDGRHGRHDDDEHHRGHHREH